MPPKKNPELSKSPEPKKQEPKPSKFESPKKFEQPQTPPPPVPEPEAEEDEQINEGMDEASKRKRQAEMFKKYLEQTGIAMAFQVVFAQILDKKIQESKVFSYTAMRLRQIGEDLEKIKLSKK